MGLEIENERRKGGGPKRSPRAQAPGWLVHRHPGTRKRGIRRKGAPRAFDRQPSKKVGLYFIDSAALGQTRPRTRTYCCFFFLFSPLLVCVPLVVFCWRPDFDSARLPPSVCVDDDNNKQTRLESRDFR